jgi:hypothetical protein
VFCSSATSRNVTIVVMVLMTGCRVSISPRTRMLGSHSATMSTHAARNSRRLANAAADGESLEDGYIGVGSGQAQVVFAPPGVKPVLPDMGVDVDSRKPSRRTR